jgi:hypothetical protein
MLDTDGTLSRSFSYANAVPTVDSASAEANTSLVRFFTVQLRCLGKMNVSRARLVAQSRVMLKMLPHHKFSAFVHANVMEYRRAQKVTDIQLLEQRADAEPGLTRQSHSCKSMLPCVVRVRDERQRQFLSI